MIIRQQQLATFDEASHQAFEQTVCQHVRNTYTERVSSYDDELLKELVAAGLRRARSHGLAWESSLLDFVSLMFEVAPNFDTHPKAGVILANASLDPDIRMTALYEQMSQRDWTEAARNTETSAWFAS